MNLSETMSIYVMVAERRSISAAAKDRNVSVASGRIARLDRYLGRRPLRREAYDFECTPDGVAFDECNKILNAVKRVIADGQVAIDAIRAGPLNISMERRSAIAEAHVFRLSAGWERRVAGLDAERANMSSRYQALRQSRREAECGRNCT